MLSISDDYLVGFVEGEGCFYVGVVPAITASFGWQVIPFFKVSQNPSGKVILDKLKSRLGCGYIKANDTPNSSDKSLAYVVREIDNLHNIVIPFFDGKLHIKRKSFEHFCQIVAMLYRKEHLNKEGFLKVLDIAYLINTGKRKFSKEHIAKRILTD
jgi:hypothetical protein